MSLDKGKGSRNQDQNLSDSILIVKDRSNEGIAAPRSAVRPPPGQRPPDRGWHAQRFAVVDRVDTLAGNRSFEVDEGDKFRSKIAKLEHDSVQYRRHSEGDRDKDTAQAEDYSIEIGQISDWERSLQADGAYSPSSIDGPNRSTLLWDQTPRTPRDPDGPLQSPEDPTLEKRRFGRAHDLLSVCSTQLSFVSVPIRTTNEEREIQTRTRIQTDGIFKNCLNITPIDKPLFERELLPAELGVSTAAYPPDLPFVGPSGIRENVTHGVPDPVTPGDMEEKQVVALNPRRGPFFQGGWVWDAVQEALAHLSDVIVIDPRLGEEGEFAPQIGNRPTGEIEQETSALEPAGAKYANILEQLVGRLKIRHDAHFYKSKNLTGRLFLGGLNNGMEPDGPVVFGRLDIPSGQVIPSNGNGDAPPSGSDPAQSSVGGDAGFWRPFITLPEEQPDEGGGGPPLLGGSTNAERVAIGNFFGLEFPPDQNAVVVHQGRLRRFRTEPRFLEEQFDLEMEFCVLLGATMNDGEQIVIQIEMSWASDDAQIIPAPTLFTRRFIWEAGDLPAAGILQPVSLRIRADEISDYPSVDSSETGRGPRYFWRFRRDAANEVELADNYPDSVFILGILPKLRNSISRPGAFAFGEARAGLGRSDISRVGKSVKGDYTGLGAQTFEDTTESQESGGLINEDTGIGVGK